MKRTIQNIETIQIQQYLYSNIFIVLTFFKQFLHLYVVLESLNFILNFISHLVICFRQSDYDFTVCDRGNTRI